MSILKHRPVRGKLVAVTLCRDGRTGEADGSVLLTSEAYGKTYHMRIIADDVDVLIESLKAIRPHERRRELTRALEGAA